MKKNITIALDGYSATGKSSIAKDLAQKLGLTHLDTGALYRGITLYALKHFFNNGEINFSQLCTHLQDIKLDFRNVDKKLNLFLNNTNIEKEIRDPKISEYVSEVARQPEVRAFLLKQQRDIAAQGSVIVDGRDIGTVVFPNADYKFFLTASVDERTNRRFKELQGKGINTNPEEVKKNLIMRDKIDSERLISPLRKADDAILIDNTNINKNLTVDLILSYIK